MRHTIRETKKGGVSITIRAGKGEDARNSPLAPMLGLTLEPPRPPSVAATKPAKPDLDGYGPGKRRAVEPGQTAAGPEQDGKHILGLLGKRVSWVSQAGGRSREKFGRVVAVRLKPEDKWTHSPGKVLSGDGLGLLFDVPVSRNAVRHGGSMSSRVVVLLETAADMLTGEQKPEPPTLVTPIWTLLVPVKESPR